MLLVVENTESDVRERDVVVSVSAEVVVEEVEEDGLVEVEEGDTADEEDTKDDEENVDGDGDDDECNKSGRRDSSQK